ncbi:MAG: PAS domain S-box protein [Methanomassiliicoccales archaeon]|nr:PAS domain S-box protein [Methanomassiliicoccales archaeon]
MNNALIVDDNVQNLYMLDTILRSAGYHVVMAKNGEEALDAAKKNQLDLIISDILMPVMDGFQFCQRCNADDSLRDIPFIFYTATYTDEKDERFALGLGADRFLIKPMKPDQLLAAIKEVRERPHSESKKVAENDPTVLREYGDILFHKLEKKVMELEKDIAERKAAETALRESEERFRKVFESGAVGIAIIDLSGRVTRANDELCDMLGYVDTELIGMDLLDMAHLDHRQDLKESSQRMRAGDIPAYTMQARFMRKDGSIVWSLLKVSIMNDAEGHAQYYLAFASDITEYKIMRERERQALSQIERNLEQLATLNDQIRNPLSIIVALLACEERPDTKQKILDAVRSIDDIVHALDIGWSESAKVREFLEKNQQINRRL